MILKENRKQFFAIWILAMFVFVGSVHAYEAEDFMSMTLEELMDVEVYSSGSLTETSLSKTPATITVIDKEDIYHSGARSLFELLDMYVPNLQWLHHNWEADHMGLRGIMNDRDDKYLMLINGRVMNDRTHYGALSERDLVLLADIHHIDVIRGPGSGLYGPGAISMVINIVTESGETFEGTEWINRVGAVEEFYSTELKHGQQFDDDSSIYIYGGIAKYLGADQHDAPLYHGNNFTTFDDTSEQAGTPSRYPVVNDGGAWRDLPPLKGYIEYRKDDWILWARLTRGGQKIERPRGAVGRPWPNGWNHYDQQQVSGTGYLQATGYIGRTIHLNDNAHLDLAFSYDMLDFERVTNKGVFPDGYLAYREDEYYAKSILKWDLSEQHKIAAGFEFRHEEYGLDPIGYPSDYPINSSFTNNDMPRWSSNMYSWVGEWQWQINDQYTSFIGARLDDHSRTAEMFSPRGALVYQPDEKNTYKLMGSRSVRMNFAEEMKRQEMEDGTDSDPEILDSVEFRYERQHTENFLFGGTIFYHILDVITRTGMRNSPAGTQKTWGLELEAKYQMENTRILFSHSYSKLVDYLPGENSTDLITPKHLDYGDDLQQWSNHQTKLNIHHKLSEKFALNSSVRYYWGYQGKEDYAKYKENNTPGWSKAGTKAGWDDAFKGNIYLNLGLEYIHSDNLKVRIDGYNLLGMFDKELNGRSFYTGHEFDTGVYRAHAPALGVSLTYTF